MPSLALDSLPTAERHAKCLAAFQFMLDLALNASSRDSFTQEEHARAERVKALNTYYRDETLYALAFRADLSNDERLLVKSLYEAEMARYGEILPLAGSGTVLSQAVTDCADEMALARES